MAVLERRQERRDTAANWASNNPTLAAGEIGVDTTNGLIKIGDGATAWASLGYFHVAPRVGSITSSATPSIDCALYEQYNITALAAAITSWTISNPFDGGKLIIRIKDNATARALAFSSVFRFVGTTAPTTTVVSKTLYLGCIYNGADSKLDVVALAQEA